MQQVSRTPGAAALTHRERDVAALQHKRLVQLEGDETQMLKALGYFHLHAEAAAAAAAAAVGSVLCCV